jgi:hypothetical protein
MEIRNFLFRAIYLLMVLCGMFGFFVLREKIFGYLIIGALFFGTIFNENIKIIDWKTKYDIFFKYGILTALTVLLVLFYFEGDKIIR